ncbi:hypothetical protein BJ928_11879 [Rhizobium sp. WW_1]|jgi:hypothetical protein|nr:hypothetical protein BJ928_11879 [Rhizobium sp. WW_1]
MVCHEKAGELEVADATKPGTELNEKRISVFILYAQ